MGSRGSEGWKSNCGGFVAAAFGALWTGSANPTHEMNIRWSEGAVRDFASGEVKAEFRVWGWPLLIWSSMLSRTHALWAALICGVEARNDAGGGEAAVMRMLTA